MSKPRLMLETQGMGTDADRRIDKVINHEYKYSPRGFRISNFEFRICRPTAWVPNREAPVGVALLRRASSHGERFENGSRVGVPGIQGAFTGGAIFDIV